MPEYKESAVAYIQRALDDAMLLIDLLVIMKKTPTEIRYQLYMALHYKDNINNHLNAAEHCIRKEIRESI